MTAQTAPAQPLADHLVDVGGGRRAGVAEWGDPAGAPVVLLHRSPGSRLLDPDPAATAEAGVRLVTIDRPGYGRTDPVAVPTRAAAARDVAAVVDALGLEAPALVGWSGGGQFAIEAAIVLGERVRALVTLAMPAPPEEVDWGMPEEMAGLVAAIAEDPEGTLPVVREAMGWYAGAPRAAALADDSAADVAWREAHPAALAAMEAMMAEGARGGVEGLVFDMVAGSRRDPFDAGGVRAPMTILHGAGDTDITPEHARWWAARVPHATLELVPGVGHLLAMTHWARALERARA